MGGSRSESELSGGSGGGIGGGSGGGRSEIESGSVVIGASNSGVGVEVAVESVGVCQFSESDSSSWAGGRRGRGATA
jgi:hypothetical protein